MFAIERSYPKVSVVQILKWYLKFFSSYSTAQVVFQNPPRIGGVDFLAHHGSS